MTATAQYVPRGVKSRTPSTGFQYIRGTLLDILPEEVKTVTSEGVPKTYDVLVFDVEGQVHMFRLAENAPGEDVCHVDVGQEYTARSYYGQYRDGKWGTKYSVRPGLVEIEVPEPPAAGQTTSPSAAAF